MKMGFTPTSPPPSQPQVYSGMRFALASVCTGDVCSPPVLPAIPRPASCLCPDRPQAWSPPWPLNLGTISSSSLSTGAVSHRARPWRPVPLSGVGPARLDSGAVSWPVLGLVGAHGQDSVRRISSQWSPLASLGNMSMREKCPFQAEPLVLEVTQPNRALGSSFQNLSTSPRM